MKHNFIPVWEYCKKYGVTKQTVYRWIREKKLEGKYKRVEKTVQRIVIQDQFPITQ